MAKYVKEGYAKYEQKMKKHKAAVREAKETGTKIPRKPVKARIRKYNFAVN